MAVEDSYTISLLHFDGAAGSTIFTDESDKTWTPAGAAQVSGLQKVFGAGAGSFPSPSDYIRTGSHVDFDFGTDAFTVDFRARLVDNLNSNCFVLFEGSSRLEIWFYQAALNVQIGPYGDSYSWSPFADTWYHIAVTRDSSANIRVFIGGVQIGATIADRGVDIDSSSYVQVFGPSGNGARSSAGWMDELRISKGIARWTTNFTVPVLAYGDYGNSVNSVASWNPNDTGGNMSFSTDLLTATHA